MLTTQYAPKTVSTVTTQLTSIRESDVSDNEELQNYKNFIVGESQGLMPTKIADAITSFNPLSSITKKYHSTMDAVTGASQMVFTSLENATTILSNFFVGENSDGFTDFYAFIVRLVSWSYLINTDLNLTYDRIIAYITMIIPASVGKILKFLADSLARATVGVINMYRSYTKTPPIVMPSVLTQDIGDVEEINRRKKQGDFKPERKSCPLGCPGVFNNQHELNGHYKDGHTGKEDGVIIACSLCKHESRSVGDYTIHYLARHRENIQCDCGTICSSPYYAARHRLACNFVNELSDTDEEYVPPKTATTSSVVGTFFHDALPKTTSEISSNETQADKPDNKEETSFNFIASLYGLLSGCAKGLFGTVTPAEFAKVDRESRRVKVLTTTLSACKNSQSIFLFSTTICS